MFTCTDASENYRSKFGLSSVDLNISTLRIESINVEHMTEMRQIPFVPTCIAFSGAESISLPQVDTIINLYQSYTLLTMWTL